jgi:DNA-binding response OmpR family regulator
MDKRKILVVDDEVSLTRMLKLNLEETGKYEVRTENQGSKTISTALDFRPDLILLDIMMPDKIGSEVAAELIKNKELKDIKIIFLTALVSKHEAEIAHGKIAGRSFIAKPVKIDELIESIEKELGENNS